MWSREALATAVRTRAFWIRYGLCLFQVLVIVAYFLPWERTYAGDPYPPRGLLEWMYSEITNNPTDDRAFFIVSLLICLIATIVSLVLAMIALMGRREHVSAFRVSSMFSSLAITGPLLFLHRYMPWPSGSADLSHLWPLISEMSIGWHMALLSGSAACVLALILYHEAYMVSESESDHRGNSSSRVQGTTLISASFLIIAVGCVMTVAGFFQTWNTCYSSNFVGDPYQWSNNGSGISPLMYLVLLAVVMSTWLLILSLFVGKMKSLVFMQISQNLLVMALVFTLFWELAFGEYRFLAIDLPSIVARLQLGWYLCVIGLSIMLVFMYIVQRFLSASSSGKGILCSENTSMLPT